MRGQHILQILLVLSLLVLTSCQNLKHPNYACEKNDECVSGNCENGACAFSLNYQHCEYDFDCKKGEGLCKSSLCLKSNQGDSCRIDEDCAHESNFCHISKGEKIGKCLNEAIECKGLAESLSYINIFALIAVLGIAFLVVIVGGSILSKNAVDIKGLVLTYGVLAIFIVAGFILINYYWFSNCV